MLNFWGKIEDELERIYRIIANWDRPLKIDWDQSSIAPIEKKQREVCSGIF